MRVLGIPLFSFKDLVRLAVSVKREHISLLSYPYNKKYVVGLYLPPFTKELSALFPYILLDKKPSSRYSYTSGIKEHEEVRVGIVNLSDYIPIYISFIKEQPHKLVNLDSLSCELRTIELEDIHSLVYLSISLTDNWTFIPFLWYDTVYKRFVLTLEANPREDIPGELLILTLDYRSLDVEKDNFIVYDQSKDSIEFSSGYKGVSYQYVSIIKTYKLPYYACMD